MGTPLYTYQYVRFSEDQSYQLGSQATNIILDGSQPFTIVGWFKFLDTDMVQVLQKDNELSIGVNDDELYLNFLSATTPSSNVVAGIPIDKEWHFLCFGYSPQDPQTPGPGTLKISIDGSAVYEATPTPTQGNNSYNPLTFGNGDFECNSLTLYQEYIFDAATPIWNIQPPAPKASLKAAWDFTVNPPVDTSGNNSSYSTSTDPPESRVRSYGLMLDGFAHALVLPNVDKNILSSSTFTVHTWAYAEVPDLDYEHRTLTIYSTIGTDNAKQSQVSFSLVYNADQNAFTLECAIEDENGYSGVLSSNSFIQPEEWHHVAVTLDGSNNLQLFIDGVVDNQMTIQTYAITSPVTTIGAKTHYSAPGGLSNFYRGTIQALGLWNITLSAAQITSYMTSPPDNSTTGCVGYYDFASIEAVDSITGSRLPLLGDADLDSVEESSISSTYVAKRSEAHDTPLVPFKLEFPSKFDASIRPKSDVFSDQVIDNLLEHFEKTLDKHSPPQLKEHYRTMFRENLNRGIALHNESEGYSPGMIEAVNEGGFQVFYEHVKDGRNEIARISAVDLDDCTAWIISVVALSFSALFGVLGLGFSAAKLTSKVLIPWFASGLGFGARASLLTLFNGANLSGETFIKVVQTIWQSGELGAAVSAGLSGVSWWSWGWAVASAVFEIVGLWLTGGWYLVYVIAQLVVYIYQLDQLVKNKPTSC